MQPFQRLFSIIILHFIFIHPFFAQKKYENWGEISKSDLKMSVYEQDSLASSVVLHDIGSIRVTTNYKGNWIVEHTKVRRLKIFDVSALSEGNLLIPYRADRSVEKMSDLEVQVFSPEGELKKVKSDNVFTERLSKNWMAKKIFIPNLQKGCIIEYRYTLTSEYIFSLYDWYFQDDKPVRWSEVRVSIPAYFDYVMLLKAQRNFDLNEVKSENESGNNGRSFLATETRYGMANVPAIKSEPYITTLEDYREQVGFQLSKVQFPDNIAENIMTTWENLGKTLEDEGNMGAQYLKNGNHKELWNAFSATLTKSETPEELMEKARKFVSSHIKWDESYRVFTDHTIDKSFQEKSGSTADINLAVVALLRHAGLDAYPVLLSTIDNGAMQDIYPFYTQFNSVVACVRAGDNRTIIDASSPYIPVGQMRLKHYNQMGWLMDDKKPEWLSVRPNEVSFAWLGKLKLTEEGTVTGSFDMMFSGINAAIYRSELTNTTPLAFIKNNFNTGFADIAFDSVEVSDLEDITKPLRISFKVNVQNAATVANDYIYFKPVFDFVVTENPFKSPERSLPISFPYPFKANYVLNLELPEGYQLEDLPKPQQVALPGDIAKIVFRLSPDATAPRKITLSLRATLSETNYAPENYEPVRTFFNLMYEKTSMQMVAKKNQ